MEKGGIVMGFLDAIFHAAAISMVEAQREVRQDKQRERELYDRCLMAEVSLNDFLKRTGCPSNYLSDSRNCEFEISKMKDLKRKYEEYLSLGGDPQKVRCIEDIDQIVIKLKKSQYQLKNSSVRKQNQLTVAQRDILEYLSYDSLYDHDTRSPNALTNALKEGGFCDNEISWALEHLSIDWSKKAEETAFYYLEDDDGFSRKQLKRMLMLEGFSDSIIQQVIELSKIDWCAQALKIINADVEWSKRSELSTTPNELKKELIDDNGFSKEEAQYAVEHCCMDWQAEVVKRAHELQRRIFSISDFTRDSLKKDLADDGFSDSIIQLVISSNQTIDWNSYATKIVNLEIEINNELNFVTTPKGLKELLIEKHYTEEEVQYAIANCCVNWQAEVAKRAHELQKYAVCDFTRDSLEKNLADDCFSDNIIQLAISSNQIINWNGCATEMANWRIEIHHERNYTTTPKELKEELVDEKHYTEEEA